MLEEIGLEEGLDIESVAVLRRQKNPLDLDGPLDAMLVDLVPHRHLRLAIGT